MTATTSRPPLLACRTVSPRCSHRPPAPTTSSQTLRARPRSRHTAARPPGRPTTAAAKRYALVIRQGEVTAAARVAAARRAFDVSPEPDSRGPGYDEAFGILDSLVRRMSEDAIAAAPDTQPPSITELRPVA